MVHTFLDGDGARPNTKRRAKLEPLPPPPPPEPLETLEKAPGEVGGLAAMAMATDGERPVEKMGDLGGVAEWMEVLEPRRAKSIVSVGTGMLLLLFDIFSDLLSLFYVL